MKQPCRASEKLLQVLPPPPLSMMPTGRGLLQTKQRLARLGHGLPSRLPTHPHTAGHGDTDKLLPTIPQPRAPASPDLQPSPGEQAAQAQTARSQKPGSSRAHRDLGSFSTEAASWACLFRAQRNSCLRLHTQPITSHRKLPCQGGSSLAFSLASKRSVCVCEI